MTDFVNSHFMPVICNQELCERWTCVQVNLGKLCGPRLKEELAYLRSMIADLSTWPEYGPSTLRDVGSWSEAIRVWCDKAMDRAEAEKGTK